MAETSTTKPYVIVLGYDMSEQAERALEQALGLAGPHPAVELHVLGVLDDRRSLGHPTGQKYDFAAAEGVRDTIQEVVKEKLTALGSDGLNLYVHVRIGSPAPELVEVAREAEANVLVVGTHGRSGVGRLFLGSVAEKVVRHAPCPVLVARQPAAHENPDPEFQPEPACPVCTAKREETDGAVWWCEQHSKKHIEPHIFTYSNGIAQTRPGHAPLM